MLPTPRIGRRRPHRRTRLQRLVAGLAADSYHPEDRLSIEGMAVWSLDPSTDTFALTEGLGENRRSTIRWQRGRAREAKLTMQWSGHFTRYLVTYGFLETPILTYCPLTLDFLDDVSGPSWQTWVPTKEQAEKLAALEVPRSHRRWGKDNARIRFCDINVDSRKGQLYDFQSGR